MIKLDHKKPRQIAITAAIVFSSAAVAVYHTFNPSPNDYQAMVDFHFHPIASVFGAVLPSFVLAPFTYWAAGRTMPRLASWVQSVKCKIFRSGYAVTRNWRPEHRAGLVAASIGGATLAVAVGYVTSGWSRWGLANWLAHHSGDAIIWAIIGAFVIGTAVYCHRAFSVGDTTNGEVSEQPSENGPATCVNIPTKERAASRDADLAQSDGPEFVVQVRKRLDAVPARIALSLIGGVAVAGFVAVKAIMAIAPDPEQQQQGEISFQDAMKPLPQTLPPLPPGFVIKRCRGNDVTCWTR